MTRNNRELLTASLLYEYTALISSIFGGVVSPSEFVAAFNQELPNYQRLNKKKVDPHFIEQERASTCTSAALLMGLWATLTDNGRPLYYVEHGDLSDDFHPVSKSKAHCKVGLQKSADQSPQYFHLKDVEDLALKTKKLTFTSSSGVDKDEYFLVSRTPQFLGRALSTFGIYNHRVAELSQPTTENQKQALALAAKPEEFFSFLKWCYASHAQV